MNFVASTIFGCLIIFVCTTLGATIVFFLKRELGKRLNSIICGFSAGVMLAASVFGLLIPAIENSASYQRWSFVPAAVGVALGGAFICVIDLVSRLIARHKGASLPKSKLKRFVLAFTIHNIPEGMAVGAALGGALAQNNSAAMVSALMLAVGIAIQNIPEGIAVALPVFQHTSSKWKGFAAGTLSGLVEPIFAILGLMLASKIQILLAYSLSFSAGAMLFVSFEDLVPDAKENPSSHIGTWSIVLGFLIMMILDVALG